MRERTFIFTIQVSDHDEDLFAKVPDIIRNRFEGTAFTVAHCHVIQPLRAEWQAGYRLGWDAAIKNVAEGS